MFATSSPMIWPCALIVLIARTTPIDPNKQSTLCFIYSSFCSSATKGYLAAIPMGRSQSPSKRELSSDSRCQTTTARYKCNRVANTITLNPPHLLKKIVPTILMCRRFRENQSERGGGKGSRHACKHRAYSCCWRVAGALNGFDIFYIRVTKE